MEYVVVVVSDLLNEFIVDGCDVKLDSGGWYVVM